MCTCNLSAGEVETGGSLGLSGQWSVSEYSPWGSPLASATRAYKHMHTHSHMCVDTPHFPHALLNSEITAFCPLPSFISRQLCSFLLFRGVRGRSVRA